MCSGVAWGLNSNVAEISMSGCISTKSHHHHFGPFSLLCHADLRILAISLVRQDLRIDKHLPKRSSGTDRFPGRAKVSVPRTHRVSVGVAHWSHIHFHLTQSRRSSQLGNKITVAVTFTGCRLQPAKSLYLQPSLLPPFAPLGSPRTNIPQHLTLLSTPTPRKLRQMRVNGLE